MRSVAGSAGIDSAFRDASATITADLEQSGSFVTLFHARMNGTTGRVSYIDAGHGLALHIPLNATPRRLTAARPPVGALTEQQWPASNVDLAPGESLVVISDGVLDAFEALGDFTVQRIRQFAPSPRPTWPAKRCSTSFPPIQRTTTSRH